MVVERPAPAISELLAIPEFGAFVLSAPWLATAPRGIGRRVLVLPGFTAGDVSTAPLRFALRALGHRPAPWGLGLNVGPDVETVRQLLRRLDQLVQQNRGPIDIVGWSLGGIMARLLALHHPGREESEFKPAPDSVLAAGMRLIIMTDVEGRKILKERIRASAS